MAKVNEDLKKQVEAFNRQVENNKRQKVKTEKFTPYSTQNLESDISKNTKRMSKFTNSRNYKINMNEFRDSGVSDNGFNQDVLDNNTILYNSDTNNNAPKKMRRIVSSNNTSSGNRFLQGQGKLFGGMFTQQSKLMVRMHSEKMAMNTKFGNSMLEYTKNISEQVTQMNKIKNSIQIDFYKNSLTTQSSILEELKSINKTLKTGFNLNDKGEKIPNKEMDSLIRQVFSGGSLRGNAKKVVMQLASEAFNQGSGGAGLALGMLLPMLQSRGGIRSLAGFGVKQGLTFGASKLLGGKFSKMMSDPGRFFENMMTAWGLGGGIKGWIGKRLGRQGGGLNTDIDITKYINKDFKGRANFDNAAHTALTKVITRSLANIEASLTGKAAMYYNYATNQFETIEQAEKTLQTSYTDTLKKQLRDAKKELLGGTTKKRKNKFGGGETEYVDEGLFGKILNLDDINNSNVKFLKDMIRKRGPQLADALMKIVLFFAERDVDPGSVLDIDDLSLSFVTKVMYPKELLDNAKPADMNKYMESADHVRRFLTVLRELPGKKAREIWDDLLSIVNDTHDATAKAAEEAFRSAEGGIGQWAAYTYGEVVENGKFRAATRAELDKKLEESRKTADISGLRDLQIDLTGVMTEDDLRVRIRDEYNRMCAPLFKGTTEKIVKNLKAKATQLEKAGHFFAPYMRQTADAFAKGGDIAFKDVDYATLAGVESYVDIMKNKAPEFDGRDYKTAINSAKDIAKWHLENNAKVRGVAGTVMTASYAALIKQMYESTGMTGPFASSIIGITAASTAVLSGKMHKIMDVMGTSVGDEKMLDKNGKETDVTKRQAMTEAMYREFLPKMWGQRQGAKLGGWIRNNIRFGPILGPVIGMTTGWILGRGASVLLKIGGLFGKVAKFALNKIGQKITGNKESMWGDTIRDIARAKMGLPPVATQFTSKDVFNQVGPRKANKWHHLIATFTGQKVEDIMEAEEQGDNPVTDGAKKVRKDIETRLIEAQAMVREKHAYNSPLDSEDGEGMSGMGKGYQINNDPLKGIRQNVLTVRVVGGHLDAVGVVGVIDAETYANKVKDMANKASTTNRVEMPKDVPDKSNWVDLPNYDHDKDKWIELPKDAHNKGLDNSASDVNNRTKVVNQDLKNAQQFMDTDPEAKDEAEDQDRQEHTEEQNKENIEKIAKNGTGNGKEKPKKEKKKGFLGNLVDVLTGKGNLFSLIGSIPKMIPLLLMGIAFWPQIKGLAEKYLPGLAEGGFNIAKFLGKGAFDIAKFLGKGALDLGVKGVKWLGGKALDLGGKAISWGMDKLNPIHLFNTGVGAFNSVADKYYQKRQKGDILPDGKISMFNDLVRMLLLDSKNRHMAFNLLKAGWGIGKGVGKLGLKIPGMLWNMTPFGKVTKLLGINNLTKKAFGAVGNWGKNKLLDARTVMGIIGKTGWSSIKNRFGAAGKIMTKDMIEQMTRKFGKDGAEQIMRYAKNGVISKSVYKKFAEAASKSTIDMAEKGATFASKSGVIGRIAGFMMKGVDKLTAIMLKIPGLEKLTEKIATKFIPGVKKICQELLEKISGKLVKEGGEKAAKKGFLGAVKGLFTAGGITAVLNIGFIAWDAWQGAKKAKEFFSVSEDDQPTGVQKWACAITYALLSLIESIPGCMIVTSIVSALDPVMKWLCRKVYGTLNMCLNVIGCGDGIQEEEDMKILEVGAEKDDEGKLFATRDQAQGKYEKLKNQAEEQKKKDPNADEDPNKDNIDYGYGSGSDNGSDNSGGYNPEEAFKYYAVQQGTGGSGTGGSITSLSGKPAKGNVPAFFSQNWLPAGRIDGLDIQSDGCALAVMKMIGAYKGLNISDDTLIEKMRQYKLSNRTVSIEFFKDFGSQNTSNRDDIKSAVLSGNCCMALLISANGSKHFIALISKDKNTLYIGDPMKTAWEEISCNDASIISYSIAAAIFNGAIVTNIGTPKQVGGSGVGGFGKNAKPIDHFFGVKNNARKAARGAIMNIFNNGSDEYYEDEGTNTDNNNNNTTTNDLPVSGGLSFDPKQIKDNGGWTWDTLPDWESRSYDGTKKLIDALSSRFGIPADVIRASMYMESSFNPNARTGSYVGLGQLNSASWNGSIDDTIGGIKYNAGAYGIKKIGAGGDLHNNRQNATVFAARIAHDSKVFAKNGAKQVTAGMLHLTHMLPTAMNYIGGPDINVKDMHGVTRGYIDGNPYSLTTTGAKGGPPAMLSHALSVENKKMEAKLQEAMKDNSAAKKGGKGYAPLNDDPLFWGRGSFNIDRAIVNTMHTQAKHVEDSYKWSKDKMCGMAAALFVLKLAYHHLWQKFTPNEIKAWGERTKGAFSKDYGVNQNFFIALGMKPIDIKSVYNNVKSKGKRVEYGEEGGWPFVSLGVFASGPNAITPGEVLVANTVSGHWVTIARAKDGTVYLSDPDKKNPRPIGRGEVIAVRFALHAIDPNQIVNILDRNAKASGGGKSSGNNGNSSGGGGNNNPSGGGTDTDVPDNTDDTGNSDSGTPNKGTSTALGGWFWKDGEGNINQVFFGTKTKKTRSSGGNNSGGQNNNQNNSAPSGAVGPLSIPASCDATPGLAVDNTQVTKDSVNWKIGVTARTKHIDSKMNGNCATGVSTILQKSIGTYPGGNANTFLGSPVHTSDVATSRKGHVGERTRAKTESAKSAPKMKKLGFIEISVASNPQPGDILAFTHPVDFGWYGHITCLGDNGQWYSDGPQPNGWYVYNSDGPKEKIKATLWRYKGQGLGDGGTSNKKSSKSSRAANYYSKGGNQNRGAIDKKIAATANKVYTKKADGKGPGVHEPGILVNEMSDGKSTYRTFKFTNDPSRQASANIRDINAKAKYNREMRYRDEGRNMKEFGMFKVSYSNKDDVIARSLSTASGYVQDLKSDKPLINALTRLAGAITDSTVQEKLGTRQLLKEKEKQTEILREATEEVESINKSTEKLVKSNLDIIPKMTDEEKKAELARCFNLIKQAEKEMFVGLNN